MRNFIERPNPKFRLSYNIKDRFYGTWSNWDAQNQLTYINHYQCKEVFEFEDELKLVKIIYKGHIEVESITDQQKYYINSSNFERLLFSDYLKLDIDNRMYFTGRWTFTRLGNSLFLKPMDVKK